MNMIRPMDEQQFDNFLALRFSGPFPRTFGIILELLSSLALKIEVIGYGLFPHMEHCHKIWYQGHLVFFGSSIPTSPWLVKYSY